MVQGSSKQQGTTVRPMEAPRRPQASATATAKPSYQQNAVPYASVPRQNYSAYAAGPSNYHTFPSADTSDRTGGPSGTTKTTSGEFNPVRIRMDFMDTPQLFHPFPI
jgi:hypothetical protein